MRPPALRCRAPPSRVHLLYGTGAGRARSGARRFRHRTEALAPGGLSSIPLHRQGGRACSTRSPRSHGARRASASCPPAGVQLVSVSRRPQRLAMETLCYTPSPMPDAAPGRRSTDSRSPICRGSAARGRLLHGLAALPPRGVTTSHRWPPGPPCRPIFQFRRSQSSRASPGYFARAVHASDALGLSRRPVWPLAGSPSQSPTR